jgi:hypothetical protein
VEDNDPVSELRLVIERLPAGVDALREEARAEGYYLWNGSLPVGKHAECGSMVMARHCSRRM